MAKVTPDQSEPQPNEFDELLAEVGEQPKADATTPPETSDAPPAEGTTEPEVPAAETLEQRVARLEAEGKSKDRTLTRVRQEQATLVSKIAGAETEEAKREWAARLREASEDPEKADALVADLMAGKTAPPVDEDTIRIDERGKYGTWFAEKMLANLSLSNEEFDAAYDAAATAAKADGRESPVITEVLAYGIETVKTRGSAEREKRIADMEAELEALRVGEAGDRLRKAGGPDEVTPAVPRRNFSPSVIEAMSDRDFEANLDDILESESQRVKAARASR